MHNVLPNITFQVKEREAELEQCYMRMEKGEAPNDDIEKEWMKKLRDQARKRQEKEAAMMVSEAYVQLSSCIPLYLLVS